MNGIVIYNARIARDLIKKRFNLVDIKPHLEMRIKTVFFFENTEELKEYLREEHRIYIK